MYVKGIHLNYEVVNADKMKSKCTECTEETIQLNLSL
jgi:hypothetical protein